MVDVTVLTADGLGVDLLSRVWSVKGTMLGLVGGIFFASETTWQARHLLHKVLVPKRNSLRLDAGLDLCVMLK